MGVDALSRNNPIVLSLALRHSTIEPIPCASPSRPSHRPCSASRIHSCYLSLSPLSSSSLRPTTPHTLFVRSVVTTYIPRRPVIYMVVYPRVTLNYIPPSLCLSFVDESFFDGSMTYCDHRKGPLKPFGPLFGPSPRSESSRIVILREIALSLFEKALRTQKPLYLFVDVYLYPLCSTPHTMCSPHTSTLPIPTLRSDDQYSLVCCRRFHTLVIRIENGFLSLSLPRFAVQNVTCRSPTGLSIFHDKEKAASAERRAPSSPPKNSDPPSWKNWCQFFTSMSRDPDTTGK